MAAVVAVALAMAVVAAGCSSGTKSRPTSPAHITIVTPANSSTVTGPNVPLVVKVTGARIVHTIAPATRGDIGHVHVQVDGVYIPMLYKATATLTGLKPGVHTVTAEFVGTDHLFFANRPMASVVFTVKAP